MPWSLLSGELLHQVLQQNPVEKHCEKRVRTLLMMMPLTITTAGFPIKIKTEIIYLMIC